MTLEKCIGDSARYIVPFSFSLSGALKRSCHITFRLSFRLHIIGIGLTFMFVPSNQTFPVFRQTWFPHKVRSRSWKESAKILG